MTITLTQHQLHLQAKIDLWNSQELGWLIIENIGKHIGWRLHVFPYGEWGLYQFLLFISICFVRAINRSWFEGIEFISCTMVCNYKGCTCELACWLIPLSHQLKLFVIMIECCICLRVVLWGHLHVNYHWDLLLTLLLN